MANGLQTMFGWGKKNDSWFIHNAEGVILGPFLFSDIATLIESGEVVPGTMVSTDQKNYVRAIDAFPKVFAYKSASRPDEVLTLAFDESAPNPTSEVVPEKPISAMPIPAPMAQITNPGQNIPEDEIQIDISDLVLPRGSSSHGSPPSASVGTSTFSGNTAPYATALGTLVERYKPGPFKHGDSDTCTCPHCWTVFVLEDALNIARHPDLLGDPFLGPNAAQRFKATRFTVEGLALDPGGMPSVEMACPNCHLQIPKSVAELRPLYLSIIGAPKSGKSYLLAALTWQLRQSLTNDFGFAFTDADAAMNISLHNNEERLFLPNNPEAYVKLDKTQEQGGQFYNSVNYNGQVTLYPRPFIFNLRALDHNPISKNNQINARSVILYDNAGEHFQPGSEHVNVPTTQHLARSDCIYFVFDPTKDPHFRARIRSDDPQVQAGAELQRQDVILNEVAGRMRRNLGLRHREKYKNLLVVIVNKMDLWTELLPLPLRQPPYIKSNKYAVLGLDLGHVEDVSFSLRALLQQTCPEFVSAVEDFATDVAYIPSSAQGHSPTRLDDGFNWVRPKDIKPVWVMIPFLYALARKGLLLAGSTKPTGAEPAKLIRDIGGILFCQMPDGTTLEIPAKYAGRVLHHPESGKAFVVPNKGV